MASAVVPVPTPWYFIISISTVLANAETIQLTPAVVTTRVDMRP
jgi:hypothetical protein